MRFCYEVTKAQYFELLAQQLAKRNRMLPNLLFLAVAVWFCITRSDASLWMRIGPLGMALVLIGLSFYKKNHGIRFAQVAYERLVKQGAIKEEFIGMHTLEVDNGILLRSYGAYCDKIPCSAVTELRRMEQSSVIMTDGNMFELIPNEFLDQDNNRSKVMEMLGLTAL